MQLGPGDDKIAEQNARAPEVKQAETRLHALDPGIGSFAGGFKAVNDQPARICLEIEKSPVEAGQFDPPTSG